MGSSPIARPRSSSNIAALVLAGGRATRMGGGDKPLRLLAGRPMLDWVLDALRPYHDAIALSANGDPARFAAWGLPVLPDGDFEGDGPLAGILAGLRWGGARGAEAVLVVPGDAPLLPRGLAALLAPAPSYVVTGGQAHPLPALVATSATDALADWLRAGQPRRVRAFLEAVGARPCDFGEDAAHRFLNVNTPDDLATAEVFNALAG